MAGWPAVYRAAAELLGRHKLPICNDPRLSIPFQVPRYAPSNFPFFTDCYIFYSYMCNADGG